MPNAGGGSTGDCFPANLQEAISKQFSILRSRTKGKTFPLFNFIDSAVKLNNKEFILVEFWFSGCGPCLLQFEELRHVYSVYRDSSFEIIAVSIDDVRSKATYESLLRKKKYPWKNILDVGGTRTSSIGIERFPANVLLNKKGEVLFVDVTVRELQAYFTIEVTD